jgi:hypothetical protein
VRNKARQSLCNTVAKEREDPNYNFSPLCVYQLEKVKRGEENAGVGVHCVFLYVRIEEVLNALCIVQNIRHEMRQKPHSFLYCGNGQGHQIDLKCFDKNLLI